MTQSRRDFFKIVAGGITFLLAKNDITEAATKAYTSIESNSGLIKPIIPLESGKYLVRVVDIGIKPSVIRPEELNFWFSFQTLDNKTKLTQTISPRAPWEIKKICDKGKLEIIADSLDLTELIGKEIEIKVDKIDYMNRKVNRISQ